MEYTFEWLLQLGRRKLTPPLFDTLLRDYPEHHAPKWHVYGVLGHAYAVIEAAKELKKITQVDVIAEAVLHDAGKLSQFPRALGEYARGERIRAYRNHESLSADIAHHQGLPPESVSAIRHHGLAYQLTRIENLYRKLGTKEAAIKWLVLCAADAAGKGFPEGQKEDRGEKIPQQFRGIAAIVGIDPDDPLLTICCEAVTSWPPPQIPKFT